MALRSKLFSGDTKLEAAAISDPAHIVPGAVGPHVGKIQQALIKLDGAAIAVDFELRAGHGSGGTGLQASPQHHQHHLSDDGR